MAAGGAGRGQRSDVMSGRGWKWIEICGAGIVVVFGPRCRKRQSVCLFKRSQYDELQSVQFSLCAFDIYMDE